MLERLALAYAPAWARSQTLALLALDTRFAAIVRSSREPMLAQLRLAWWREQLRTPMASHPAGEPLLAALHGWEAERDSLGQLADGWDAMTGAKPLAASALQTLAQGRGAAFAGLARLVADATDADEARHAATGWALADIASRLSDPAERATAEGLARTHGWRRPRLPRALRSLAVLNGVANAAVHGERPLTALSRGDMVISVRIGLLGR